MQWTGADQASLIFVSYGLPISLYFFGIILYIFIAYPKEMICLKHNLVRRKQKLAIAFVPVDSDTAVEWFQL